MRKTRATGPSHGRKRPGRADDWLSVGEPRAMGGHGPARCSSRNAGATGLSGIVHESSSGRAEAPGPQWLSRGFSGRACPNGGMDTLGCRMGWSVGNPSFQAWPRARARAPSMTRPWQGDGEARKRRRVAGGVASGRADWKVACAALPSPPDESFASAKSRRGRARPLDGRTAMAASMASARSVGHEPHHRPAGLVGWTRQRRAGRFCGPSHLRRA